MRIRVLFFLFEISILGCHSENYGEHYEPTEAIEKLHIERLVGTALTGTNDVITIQAMNHSFDKDQKNLTIVCPCFLNGDFGSVIKIVNIDTLTLEILPGAKYRFSAYVRHPE